MRKYKGYMTIEASFVVPLVVFVFAALIYFTNYIYTRCVLAQDCYILAFRATAYTSDVWQGDLGGYVMNKSSKVAGNKYYGSNKPCFSAVVRGKNIEVSGKTVVRHSAINNAFRLPEAKWETDVTMKAVKRDFVKHIRTVKRVKDIGFKE